VLQTISSGAANVLLSCYFSINFFATMSSAKFPAMYLARSSAILR
jgi:hypothetical protein